MATPQTHCWKESKQLGVGILWGLSPHLIDQDAMLFGMPYSVYAETFAQRPGAEVIDYFDIRFAYPKELRVFLSSSSLVLSLGPKYEIYGLHRAFVKYGCDSQEQALIDG